jgi:hypothetical protein
MWYTKRQKGGRNSTKGRNGWADVVRKGIKGTGTVQKGGKGQVPEPYREAATAP